MALIVVLEGAHPVLHDDVIGKLNAFKLVHPAKALAYIPTEVPQGIYTVLKLVQL
jgi:hypothetical protein